MKGQSCIPEGGWGMEIEKMKNSPPAIDDLGVSILEPPEALPERPFHPTLHSIDLIASHPLLPLKLRVLEAPATLRS